jgi:hypothetical protein
MAAAPSAIGIQPRFCIGWARHDDLFPCTARMLLAMINPPLLAIDSVSV